MQGAGFRQDLCIQAPIYTLNIRHTPETLMQMKAKQQFTQLIWHGYGKWISYVKSFQR